MSLLEMTFATETGELAMVGRRATVEPPTQVLATVRYQMFGLCAVERLPP